MTDLWKELHVRALNFKGTEDRAYLQEFARRIPRFTPGCACREHWVNISKSNPPKFSPEGAYFAWTVEVHNSINKILKKPTYTVEEAKKFYTSL